LRYLSKKIGGVSKLAIHPKIANPFIERKGLLSTELRTGGSGNYRVDKKDIFYASLNFDSVTRKVKMQHHHHHKSANRKSVFEKAMMRQSHALPIPQPITTGRRNAKKSTIVA